MSQVDIPNPAEDPPAPGTVMAAMPHEASRPAAHSATATSDTQEVSTNPAPSSAALVHENIDAMRRENQDFIKSMKNVNTVKKMEGGFRRFELFMQEKSVANNILEIKNLDPAILDQYLGGFVQSLKGKDEQGELYDYEPDTITSYFQSVAKKLQTEGYPIDIMVDARFRTSREVMGSKKRKLKQLGKGNKPLRSDALSEEDEQKLWETGQLGLHNPESLLNTVWFHTTKMLGHRALQEARQMTPGDFNFVTEMKGGEETCAHIKWNERETKTRTAGASASSGMGRGKKGGNHVRAFQPKIFPLEPHENPERCPVRAICLYLSKRPEKMRSADSPFYLAINRNRPREDSAWYKASPMGIDTIGSIMKKMSVNAGLVGRFTNHSVRRTTCQRLIDNNVAPVLICQLTGHKSISSLGHYVTANLKQQKVMASILQGNQTSENIPPPTKPVTNPQTNHQKRTYPQMPEISAPPQPPPKRTPLEIVTPTASTASSVSNTNTNMAMNFCNMGPDIIQGMFAGANFSNSSININFNAK